MAVDLEIANVNVSAVYGDCIKVGSGSDTVWFHDSTCTSVGRNGVSIIAGSNVTIERVAFPKSGYCTFDIEPNSSTEVVRNIKFLNNTRGHVDQLVPIVPMARPGPWSTA